MKVRQHFNRRQILRGFGAGAVAAAFGPLGLSADVARAQAEVEKAQVPGGPLFAQPAPPARVSLVKGNDRRDIVYQALKHIEDEVLASIEGKKKILIKPNFVATNRELSATHVDAVRGILDFLKPHCRQPITVGESTASRAGTFEGYTNYGYLALEKEYGVQLVDLNKQPCVYRYVFGRGHKPTPIRIISTFLDPDTYVISAARMKTHDRAVTTLALKNILLAAPLNDYKTNDKWLTHAEYNFSPKALIHFNMFHLAQEIYPDLGVIDGFVAMEGNGPVGGTPVDARVALASLDSLALDALATRLMGFDPNKIMYLTSLAEAGKGQGDLAKVTVLGTPAEECQFHFKPHERLIEPYGLG
ncbi:DUF362 domain-containing protein [Anaerobaca lacustris]|uniref:DUF362 domain-containing protein n=1 Tax=Anaerobaca lacustris TaxID=3044600 RepID=A0AAW6TY19_9BACT|nr:DUF362 domain-containing protein [Sedimentisphaerales bacterium M17dextr]